MLMMRVMLVKLISSGGFRLRHSSSNWNLRMLIFNARVETEYLTFWNKDERAQYNKLNPHIASPPIYNPRPQW